jgi:hypothetical protein
MQQRTAARRKYLFRRCLGGMGRGQVSSERTRFYITASGERDRTKIAKGSLTHG